jgi:hypothetical protein
MSDMIQCSCGQNNCDVRLYVQDDTCSFYAPSQGLSLPVIFYLDDDQLRQLITDAQSALNDRATAKGLKP